MKKIDYDKIYLDFDDVFIKPQITSVESRSSVELKTPLIEDWSPIPVASSNMDTVTGVNMAYELIKEGFIATLHKYVSIEDITKLIDRLEKENLDIRNLFVSRGTTEGDKQKLKERLDKEPRIKSVCVDVANGYRESVFEYIKDLRSGICKDKILMVGNIATPDAALIYADLGVNIIKCGIGPGSVCITRVKTGVGIPQVSSIMEIKEAIGDKALICLDGGCKKVGDIAKGFVAGADIVMVGKMFAGFEESEAPLMNIDGKMKKRFSGMAAAESQWDGVPEQGTAEGKTVYVDYKGKVLKAIRDIAGGLRSSCTYSNARNLKELYEKGIFIRTTVQENVIFGTI